MAIIYKITNKINSKVYIGETIRTLKVRWNEHKSESYTEGHGYSYHLHCAIRKYGAENFLVEEIEKCPDDQRFIREHHYIMLFNSLEPNGYNYIAEGQGAIRIPSEVILEKWNDGYSATDIAKQLKTHMKVITSRLKSHGISQEEIYQRQGEQTGKRCSFKVLQYTLDGKFIKEWESATSCESDGYQQSAVSNVCNQKQISAYGYLWKYKQDERPITEWVERVKNKKQAGKPKKVVLQYDLNMNLIAEYESAAAAARAMGKTSKSNLCRAARENKTAYGYLWKYKED